MKNKILVLISILFTLIFLELFFILFIFDTNHYDYKNRYLLYSGKNVFKNVDNFFTYYPNKKINAKNYYLKDKKLFKKLFHIIKKHVFYQLPSLAIIAFITNPLYFLCDPNITYQSVHLP